MLSKNDLKFYRSLKLKKNRDRTGKVIIEGSRIIKDLLSQRILEPDRILVREIFLEDWANEFPYFRPFMIAASSSQLKSISVFNSPPDIILIGGRPTEISDLDLSTEDYFLYLEKVQDPGNVGAIFRTAEWFGIRAIFYSPDSAKPDNPKVIQASMGAVYRVNYKEVIFSSLSKEGTNIPIIGAMLHGQDAFQMNMPGHGLIVIGNEGSGISKEIEKRLDLKVTIPAAKSNRSESLNASIAAAILMSRIF